MSETDSNFFRTFILVLVLLIVFMAIIIFMANKLSVGEKDTNDARVQSEINKLIKPVGQVATTASSATATASAPAAGGGAVDGKAVFQKTCFACHGMGVAGAPKAGDKAAWKSHLAKGMATLYKHAIHGFTGKKGTMPAKGGNPALSDAQVEAGVNYMVGLVDPAMARKAEAASKKSQPAPAAAPAAAKGGSDLAMGKSVFQKTCFACHGMGVAGAPKAGDKAAWAPHVAKGKATLYTHAIHGFTGKKGTMPAKGGNPSLSDTQVKSAVDYMLSLVK
ncbi:MAG: c-type cytochrome [Gammaproteobacteria bacterium]